MPVAVLNAKITRLAEIGYVVKSGKKRVKRVLYDLNEKLFRLWRQMRVEAGRKRLGFIVKFLEIWFTKDELTEQVNKSMNDIMECLIRGEIDKIDVYSNKLWYLSEAVPKTKKITSKMLNVIETSKQVYKKVAKIFKVQSDQEKSFEKYFCLIAMTYSSLYAKDVNLAKKVFKNAIKIIRNTTKKDAYFNFLLFFLAVQVRYKEINVIRFILEELQLNKEQELLTLLSPCLILIEYLETKDSEIIERLHHEERIVVEDMIKMVEGKPEKKPKQKKSRTKRIKKIDSSLRSE